MSKDPFFSEPRRSGTVSLGCGTLILIAIIVAIFGRSGDANRVERVLLTVQYDLQDRAGRSRRRRRNCGRCARRLKACGRKSSVGRFRRSVRAHSEQRGPLAMIRVRDLRVDFDNVCAVHDLTLEIGAGEVCGLIGPNGAGKTTTMRAMVGLLEPTYGEVRVAGVDMREHPRDATRLIGFMPDFPPMYDDLKCWEFLDLFAASYFVPRAGRRDAVERALDLVGLMEKRDAFVGTLSRGMRQRLMLGKTLIPDPQVLLLDEPASGMDPHGRIALKHILRQLGSAGKTVVISSHILAEMTDFCTAMAIMQRGRMVINGSIDEIRERVMEGFVLLIEVLAGADAFDRIVSEDSNSGEVELRDGLRAVHYRGTPEQASDLLAALDSWGGADRIVFATARGP